MRNLNPGKARRRLDFRPAKGLKFAPLEESLQMREVYVRSIKHDINGLLAPVISYSDFFANLSDEETRDMLPRIMRFHKSSKAALDQVVKLTALMADLRCRKPIDVSFDLGNEAKKAVLSLTYANGSAKIECQFRHSGIVRGNPLEMFRAFLNILKNAHEALGEGGIISVSSRDCSINKVPFVSVSFEDNGHGMDPDMLDKVFTPGVTYKDKGQGLGLFVVQHSVASFGGLIDVESEIGMGTRFTVKIPAIEKS